MSSNPAAMLGLRSFIIFYISSGVVGKSEKECFTFGFDKDRGKSTGGLAKYILHFV